MQLTRRAREKSSSAVEGGGSTGSSTPSIGSEPQVNAEPQIEQVEVQPIATEDESLTKKSRRGFWRGLCSCCAPLTMENSGPRDPSKAPTSRPKDKKKKQRKAVTRTKMTTTTTGAQATGASGSLDERAHD